MSERPKHMRLIKLDKSMTSKVMEVVNDVNSIMYARGMDTNVQINTLIVALAAHLLMAEKEDAATREVLLDVAREQIGSFMAFFDETKQIK